MSRPNEIDADGRLELTRSATALPHHDVAHRDGRRFHVCDCEGLMTGEAETGFGSRFVVVTAFDVTMRRGLSRIITPDDARLLAASLIQLADRCDGGRPS